MTTNHHTVIGTGAAANASVFNSPLSQLDTSITTNATAIDGLETSVALLQNTIILGGAAVTLTNGAANAAQKVVTVDSSAQFVAGCYVEYTLVGGVLERNTVDTVDSVTQITLTTNIGTGGIADNSPVAVIPLGFYNSQAGIFNILNYGASPSASAAVNTAAIQAAINAMEIEAYASAYFAGTLQIPPGVFQINDTLTFRGFRGFRMVGTGGASRLVWTANAPTKVMIDILNCRNSYVGDMHIEASPGQALALIRSAREEPAEGAPRFNHYENLFLEGGINNMVIGGEGHTDANNDFMMFENIEFNNYTECGLRTTTSVIPVQGNWQAYNYMFLNCGFLAPGADYGILWDKGQGFSFVGGGFSGHTTAAVGIIDHTEQPFEFANFDEEGNAKFLTVLGQNNQVIIRDARLSGSGIGADMTMIDFLSAGGSLIIERCQIGDGIYPTAALKVAKIHYGSSANGALQARFIFNHNMVYTTLRGATWDTWPFFNTDSGILPTEATGNIANNEANIKAHLDPINRASTGAYLEAGAPFIERCGKARVVRTTNAGYDFTTFVDVPPYHVFTVICSHANTFKDKSQAGGNNLWLAGHANWTATVGSSITFYHDYDNDRFIELSRSQY